VTRTPRRDAAARRAVSLATRLAAAWLAALVPLHAVPGAAAGQQAIPVLCYHGFSEADGPAGGQLTEPFARLEAMLQFLSGHGFRSVFPDGVMAGDTTGRVVVITFDDGVSEQLRAAEMLERYGFRGVFFVIPARLDDERPGFMTGDDVARLAAAGHRVAPHGWSHRNMVSSGREVAAALARSPAAIRAHAGRDHPIADFAFPFGHYGDEIAEALVGTYRFLHTVNPGYWDGQSPLIPRMLLARATPLELYTEYLMGAEDFRPTARLVQADGSAADTAEFIFAGRLPVGEVRMLVTSADRDGRMYAAHPLGEHARMEGDRLFVDVRAHLARHHPEERGVVSYALITRDARGTRYLTSGYLQWLDPAPAPSPYGW
jgi:peptidoglycan/xylan/chitin deacetylase (PgdA/CDA1 family)